ncbi:MAG: circularly permuted type 2 ATP-grasp protein [Alphaproteobacteria bacterium]|nr:circularly permuted type 2 ATP-grasp protein [Alphaproteobacteria bacterium]
MRIASALLEGYAPLPGAADELVGPDGEMRPYWRPLIDGLSALGGDELNRLETTALRMVRDNGITYNVYGDPEEPQRPWQLDIAPLAISAAEWRRLEAGLVQRAQLLDRVASDIYGEQKLFRSGALPAALVSASPHFLRPFHGAHQPGGTYVHLYAADLGRLPDGEWVVLADRTEAPAGAGYALENRIIISQMLPELFRDCHVERLAEFFAGFRAKLFELTGAVRPHAVLLTPGPANEAYFEHAYLARYLGFTLVEGDDLTVRDRHVYLKTLSGPQKIDLILRRQDSDFCDPLELRSDSALGVPGLADVGRAGNVLVANALGSGVVETRAMMPYLPGLARQVLGEDLKLRSVETYWAGDPEQRQAITDNSGRLAILPVGRFAPLMQRGRSPVNPADRTAALSRLRLQGARYWAEAPARLSSAPVEEAARLEPRAVTLRCFVALTPDGYRAMPGGLARVADRAGAAASMQAISLQSGAVSKDVWVLSDGEVSQFSLLKSPEVRQEIRRIPDEIASRAADNLFWLGRYAERAEDFVRTLRALLTRLGEVSGFAGNATAADAATRLLVPMEQISKSAAEMATAGEVVQLVSELHSLIYDPRNHRGLRPMLQSAARAAWRVRDRLSSDAWRALNALTLPTRKGEIEAVMGFARGDLDDLIRTMAAFAGLANENMTRGPGWMFLDIGRRMERAVNTTWLIEAMIAEGDSPDERARADALALTLDIADSFMTYRARYMGVFEAAPVIDLLVLDETNPRSIAHQIATLKRHAVALPRSTPAQVRGRDKELIEAVYARLRSGDAGELAKLDRKKARGELRKLVGLIQDRLADLSNEYGESYFRLVSRRRSGAAPRTRAPKEGAG